MAYVRTAYEVVAYVVMAYVVMAYVVMAHVLVQDPRRLDVVQQWQGDLMNNVTAYTSHKHIKP